MMHWRSDRGGAGRAFSALLAVLLAIAMVSPAIAVYADDLSSEPPVEGSSSPPAAAEAGVQEDASPPAVDEASGSVQEPAPAVPEDPVVEAPSTKPSAPWASAPAPKPAQGVAAPVEPSTTTEYAEAGAFEGWTRLPQAKWTSGDVKGYVEGEWVPYRLTVVNKTDGPVIVPSMAYKMDHYWSLKNAVACDETRGWRWEVEGGPSGTYAPSVKDQPIEGEKYLLTRLPENPAFVIPKGKVGYIYFEGHLAVTWEWMLRFGRLGASGYTGSSAQARLVEWNGIGIGEKTVPIPVDKATEPEGRLYGLKFEDRDGDGFKDADEGAPGRPFVFTLTYLDSAHPFSLTATSAADGTFGFDKLPPGDYRLSETVPEGWELTTDLSGVIRVSYTGTVTGPDGRECTQSQPILVGDRRQGVTKTFSLSVTSGMPAATGYFVRYTIGAATHDLALSPSAAPGVFTASVVLPYGTTIASWRFFARAGTEEVPLSPVLGPETLTGPKTNAWEHVPGSISGHKYIDTDGDGQGDAPGVGWLIKLFRGGVLYDQATTGADGSYAFTGLIPGSYTVEEAEQSEYLRIWPEGPALGPFQIASGTAIEDADFVNAQLPGGIEVDKSVSPAIAHAGDTLTYTIDVRNTGQIAVLLTTVVDPLFAGGANLLVAPVALAPGQALSDLGMQIVLAIPAPEQDALHNTAYAEGQTSFGTVSDADDAHVDILMPGLAITKTASPDRVTDTGEVLYTVVVTNTGNTTLTVDVTDWIEGELHSTLETGLVLGPGESKTYEWTETVSAPVRDVAVAEGTDALGGTVTAEDDAEVAVDVTKTFSLSVTSGMPAATGYFVRYTIGAATHDLALSPSAAPGVFTASVVLPYGTTIASWRFFARAGTEEVPLSPVLGPETLTGPKTNAWEHVPGSISGHKYEDLDGNGMWDEGESGLAGWTIRLYRLTLAIPSPNGLAPLDLPSAWTLVAETVTGEGGWYGFSGLLPGTYRVEEVGQPGWSMTDAPEGDFVVESGTAIEAADFGNHKVMYVKTFELTFDAPPAGAKFFVETTVNGEPIRLDLVGSGPYSAAIDVEHPYEIGEVTWYAEKDGEEIVLGITEGETLEGDTTNAFTYSASVSGHKFSDDDGNGVWDAPGEVGLPGWTIALYRMSSGDGMQPAAVPDPAPGFALYDTTVTGEGGAYSFAGLLPGTYYVAEEQQEGWTQTAAPDGTFVVTNGTALTDLDFGNQEEFLPFTDTDIVKSADKSTAEPGDLVTYTLTYSNIGDGIIESVRIVDDYDERYMTPVDTAGGTVVDGTIVWIDTVPLGPGESRTITYTMRISEDMPEGTTVLRNVAVINPGGHESSWTVRVTVEEPFLPFTGSNGFLVLLAVLAAAAAAVVLRKKAQE
ncbi:MAG: SdrD B-like domain-containing protein [Anaerosomatales bacterium]|nr:SdrD B-like domain-containing protein [Anaerosomatales bacterium]